MEVEGGREDQEGRVGDRVRDVREARKREVCWSWQGLSLRETGSPRKTLSRGLMARFHRIMLAVLQRRGSGDPREENKKQEIGMAGSRVVASGAVRSGERFRSSEVEPVGFAGKLEEGVRGEGLRMIPPRLSVCTTRKLSSPLTEIRRAAKEAYLGGNIRSSVLDRDVSVKSRHSFLSSN